MVSIMAVMAARGCTPPCEQKAPGQPRPGRAADAPAWHSRSGPSALPACTTDSRHQLPIAPNLLQQEFTASAPNRVWLADMTYIPTGEGWLYLAAVLDLATRKVVGWAMRDHMRTELTLAALIMAAQRQRPGPGLIHHSDSQWIVASSWAA